ncbi:MAG: DUF2156 domain-containing protein [Lachnospiraceae bacterium]|nr:DUF2156 domain-containing protein [Lachnospiraceae bacterium]
MGKKITSSAVFVVIVLSILICIFSFANIPKFEDHFIKVITAGHMIQRFIALALLLVSYNLYKRKLGAWIITVFLLSLSLILFFILHGRIFSFIVVAMEFYALIILILNQKSFKNMTSRTSARNAIILSVIAMVAIFANAIVSYYRIHFNYGENMSFEKAFIGVVKEIFNFNMPFDTLTMFGRIISVIVWASLFGCIMFSVAPVYSHRKVSKRDFTYARDIVKKWGNNPGSYLALERDKHLWFSNDYDAIVAYGIQSDTIIVNGDPICEPKHFPEVLSEFQNWCKDLHLAVVFLGASRELLPYYKMLGYGYAKCGDEARFDLLSYDTKGKKAQKMRMNLNHANNAGLETFEYKPLEKRNPEIEASIKAVSDEWIEGKKSGVLGFTLGTVGLDNPMDKRYFYLKNAEGKIVAFNVFVPFYGMKGYMADVTRRTNDCPSGATEKLVFDGFMKFKEEGVLFGSLGLSPLSDVKEEEEGDKFVQAILDFAYNNFNRFYGFRDLHQTKERYNPSSWIPAYFVYQPKIMTIQMAYAIIAIQNPAGVGDFLKSLKK